MSNSSKQRFGKIITKLAITLACIGFIFIGVAVYLELHLYLRPIPQDFDKAMRQYVEAAKFPSAAVLVFNKDQVVFSKGYGLANIQKQQKATPDTLYQIASVSKLVTATAIMRLYEEGRLKLDDDINQHLPFKVRNPQFPDVAITFRMLLAHAGSIGDGPAYWNSYTLGQSEDPTEPLGVFLRAYFTPNAHHYDAKQNFLAAKPGSTAEYSNIGFGLLGYAVEHISGQPFNVYCQQAIFKPLNMPFSQWLYRDVDKSRVAMPYGYDALRRTFTPLGYYSFSNYPDGTLKTSTTEFMRFLQVFINNGVTIDGEQFLRPETVDEMLRAQYPELSPIPALGWAVVGDRHMHGGSDPGVDTVVMISKEEQWGVIMFANSGGSQAWRTQFGLMIREDLIDYINQYGVPFVTPGG